MMFFEEKNTAFELQGPAGKIEALLDGCPKGLKGVAIVCHPHPLHDGTMHNKVAHTLARAYRDVGIAAIRFNFRGVGASEGSYGEGVGEIEDLRAVFEYIKAKSGDLPIYLAGFSCGSMVAANGAEFVQPKHLCIVAPPAERYHYPTSFPCEMLLLQGTADEVCSAEGAFAWGESVTTPNQVETFVDGSHFFHGILVDMKKRVVKHLQASLEVA